MLELPLPMKATDEDKKLLSILQKAHFKPHSTTWAAAYSQYRAANGDPWAISPVTFSPCIKEQQLKLYENRKNGGPLKRIRHTKNLACCPLCGAPTTGSLDHYLPKEQFPEFSVMPSNLVPACALCNSGAKGGTYKGSTPGERFLHPYFDKIASNAIWQVRVCGPAQAPTFKPESAPSLSGPIKTAVDFHLANIFGQTFHVQMGTYWSQLPQLIADHFKDLGHTSAQAWAFELRWASKSSGLNGWRAALLRGVIADPARIAYIDGEAQKL